MEIPQVDLAEQPPGRRRELQDHGPPSRPEDAVHLGERLAPIRNIAETERHRGGIEDPIGKRQGLGGATDNATRSAVPCPDHLLSGPSSIIAPLKSTPAMRAPGYCRAASSATSAVPVQTSRSRPSTGRRAARTASRRQTRSRPALSSRLSTSYRGAIAENIRSIAARCSAMLSRLRSDTSMVRRGGRSQAPAGRRRPGARQTGVASRTLRRGTSRHWGVSFRSIEPRSVAATTSLRRMPGSGTASSRRSFRLANSKRRPSLFSSLRAMLASVSPGFTR